MITNQQVSKNRKAFLEQQGINGRDQAMAVFTLQSLQKGIMEQQDAACLHHVRLFCPEANNVSDDKLGKWFEDNGLIFQVIAKGYEPIACEHSITFGMVKKVGDKITDRYAFCVKSKVTPDIRNPANIRLDVTHVRVEFPESACPQ